MGSTYSLSRIFSVKSDILFKTVTDFDHYKDWNSIIPSADGSLKLGSELKLVLNFGGKRRPFNPVITEISEGTSFTLSKIFFTPRLGELSHQFKVIQYSSGKTELVQTWTGGGLIVKALWPIIAREFSSFEIFNNDLEAFLLSRSALPSNEYA